MPFSFVSVRARTQDQRDILKWGALSLPGERDPMVVDHWFMQIEKVLEAMEITSDATRIRLAAF